MATIGSKLDGARGLGPGFDFLRVTLAVAVVTWHVPAVAGVGWDFPRTPFLWFGAHLIVPMFFGLSGFLIAGSALRLSLRDFIINRSLRIVPALAVEIMLSAFILGPIFTDLAIGDYLSRPGTYAYFTNILGFINYHLPDVFAGNPSDIVNMSLWTVPFEIGCYAIMSALIYFTLLKRPWIVVAFAALTLVIGLWLSAQGGWLSSGHHSGLRGAAVSWLYGRGSALLITFCLGIAAYLWRFQIPYSWMLLAGSVAVCAAVAMSDAYDESVPIISMLTALPIVYVMAFVGVSPMPKLPLFHRGDYSYGIYLYGWPVSQAMRGWFPGLGSHPALLWLISVPAITTFAMFSWHAIEKPILRLRKKFSFVAKARLAPEAASTRPAQLETV